MRKAKELEEQLVANMKRWQKLENAAVTSTSKVLEETEHPLIRMVMEVIQNDSRMHHRTQQMLVDSLEDQSLALTPDDMVAISEMMEQHLKLERDTIALAEEALADLPKSGRVIQRYLLEYLLQDETKHTQLLENLEGIKRGMYPYG